MQESYTGILNANRDCGEGKMQGWFALLCLRYRVHVMSPVEGLGSRIIIALII